MGALIYIMKRSFVNNIKRIIKKPLYLIGYILMIAAIIAFVIFSFISPQNNMKNGSLQMYNTIITGVILAITYFQLSNGIDKGSSFFRQSDVNFVFTAPINEKRTLIYGFIKQMTMIFFMMFFLIFQIPNLKMNFPITNVGVLIFIIGVFSLFFVLSLLSVLIYSFTSKKNRNRVIAKKILNGIIGLIGVSFLVILSREKDIIKSVQVLFENKLFESIPVIGWFKVVLSFSVKKLNDTFYINVMFIVIFLVVEIIILFNINTDYYEDVLVSTERKEKLIQAKKSGTQVREIKVNKVKKLKNTYKATGAKAIFYRHILEYRKTKFFFFDISSLMIIGFGIGSKFIFHNGNIKSVLYASIYLLFLLSMQGKWVQEMEKHYIYLIPESSIKKVFYGTLAEHLKIAIDGTLLFVVAGFMFKQKVIIIILSIIAYITFGAMFVYSDIIARRFFGKIHSKSIKVLMKMLIILFIIVPSIILSVVTEYIIFENTGIGIYLGYAALILYNLIVLIIFILLSKGIFEISEI